MKEVSNINVYWQSGKQRSVQKPKIHSALREKRAETAVFHRMDLV
jgi:hypothetical protein